MISAKRWLTGVVFDPLFWKIKGMPVLKQYQDFRERQFSSVEAFRERQNKLLSGILLHALLNIPLYKPRYTEKFKDEILTDPRHALGKMPIITKAELRNHLDELHFEMGLGTFTNRSGGSTGQPTRFYQDRNYQTSALASIRMFYEWAGKRAGDRHALLWGAERDLVKGGLGLRKTFADFIGNRITLNAFRLSPERMRDYVTRINRFKPACIEGYAQTLYEFSRFIERNGLEVHSPDEIISSAGTLLPEMRTRMEKTFSTHVFDRYGSREVGGIAAECEFHNGLHVFGETNLVEVVDENGNAVAEGEEGEVLVTSLTNFTMPLIRYRIGDRAVRGKDRCACGRPYPLLQRITGRSDSSFETPTGGVVSPEFFIHLIGVMHNDGRIGKFQVVQETLNSILVRLVPVENADLSTWEAGDKVVEQIQTAMGCKCHVEFRIEKDIEPSPTGKHLYTIKHLKRAR